MGGASGDETATAPIVALPEIAMQRWAVPLLSATLIGLAGCTSADRWHEYGLASDQRYLDAQHFEELRPGMTQGQVLQLCGGAGQLEFSLRACGHDFTCVRYLVPSSDGSDKYASDFSLLFRDHVLDRILSPLTADDAIAATRPTYTLDYARALIKDNTGLHADQIKALIDDKEKQYREAPPSNLGPLVLPLMLIDTPSDETIRETARIHGHYDGQRVPLGSSESCVNELLGTPTVSIPLSDGMLLQLHYAYVHVTPPATGNLRAGIAVVLECGRTVAVLDDEFFPWQCNRVLPKQ